MLRFEAEAALRCWAITVDLAGVPHRIPPQPAEVWITTVMTGDWLDIVPGMLEDGDQAEALDQAFAAGEVGFDTCVTAARAALAQAAGCEWWWTAVRLVHMLMQPSGVGMGELLLAGVDPSRVSLGAVCQAVYRLWTREAKDKDRARLDLELSKTPPGVSAAERFDEQVAADAFERMAAVRGG